MAERAMTEGGTREAGDGAKGDVAGCVVLRGDPVPSSMPDKANC